MSSSSSLHVDLRALPKDALAGVDRPELEGTLESAKCDDGMEEGIWPVHAKETNACVLIFLRNVVGCGDRGLCNGLEVD